MHCENHETVICHLFFLTISSTHVLLCGSISNSQKRVLGPGATKILGSNSFPVHCKVVGREELAGRAAVKKGSV
eukprot:1161703-Pelagomonas_calceolata.AAC.4